MVGDLSPPRIVAIMGSGETSPTMVKVHRAIFARLGSSPVPAVVLDTPFGFQENADDIVRRAQAYFSESVGARVEAASLRSDAGTDPHARAAFVAAVDKARYVFAGPGSPTYALRVWRSSALPALLADKIRPAGTGGAVTFASAAALTLGVATLPVYEIYKAGEPPGWLEGLDLLALAGLRVAVIPHYNNAEGGNHDTRYCYLGERRLNQMEAMLPEGAFVLGVDEHTGLVLDLEEATASVVGLGAVTIRARGASATLPSGTVLPTTELTRIAGVAGSAAAGVAGSAGSGGSSEARKAGTESPLVANVRKRQTEFSAAIDRREVEEAVRAVLRLDDELVAWSRDTLESDQIDRARDVLHSMVLALGRLAGTGAKDPREVIGPFVEALLDQRARARAARRFQEADALRDQLVALGVEVRDTPSGAEWLLAYPQANNGG